MILDRMAVRPPVAGAGDRPRRAGRRCSGAATACSSTAASPQYAVDLVQATRHPTQLRPRRPRPDDRPRRQPPRHARPRARRPGAGPAPRPHVRHAAGHLRPRPRGAAPPPAAHLRRAGPRHHHRPRRQPGARDGAGHVGVAEAERQRPSTPSDDAGPAGAARSSRLDVAGRAADAAVAELVRSLEFTINRRARRLAARQHQGITPGHGSEPGESRLYQPGDDVRRIDWNVTARTTRDSTCATRSPTATSRRGWSSTSRRRCASARRTMRRRPRSRSPPRRASGSSPRATRTALGAVLVAGPHLQGDAAAARHATRCAPSCTAVADATRLRGSRPRRPRRRHRPRRRALSKRRGFVAVISDFAGDRVGRRRSPGSAMRHDLLAIADPRPARARRAADRARRRWSTRRPAADARSASPPTCSGASPTAAAERGRARSRPRCVAPAPT